MAITEAYSLNAVTVGTTELSIVSGTTTLQTITAAGVYQLFIDASNMAKSDEFHVKVYETVRAGGTKRVVLSSTLMGAQAEIFCTPSLILMNGWDMTIDKIAGTDRAFTASVRKIA
jgi:hypothetical protein